MNNNNKLFYAMVIVYMITNLIASAYLIAFQFDTVKQRTIATEERSALRKQNENIVCILRIPPTDRTPDSIKECHDTTLGEE